MTGLKRGLRISACALFIAAMVMGMWGCGAKVEIPDYSADIESKVYKIGHFVGVPGTIYNKTASGNYEVVRSVSQTEFNGHLKTMKESGINIASTGVGESSKAYVLKSIAAAEVVGIDMLVNHGDFTQILIDETITDEVAVQRAKEAVQDYKDSPRLYGHSIVDEPGIDYMPKLKTAYRRYKQIFPDKLFYVNLLPIIVTGPVIGDNYDHYLDTFMESVGDPYISYDHYPLHHDGQGNTSVADDFLYNMEAVKMKAGNEREMWTFLQSLSFSAVTRPLEAYCDAAWQAYSFMAFGGSCLQWFCYWTPLGERGFSDGMVTLQGEKTPAYDYVSQVNHEILDFDHVFLNYEWKGVMTEVGANNRRGENSNFAYLRESLIPSHDRLIGKKSSEDLLIGVFKDGEDRDGFMVVNFADPGKKLSTDVELTFEDCKNAVVYKNGKETVVKAKKGKISFTMKPGEGYFVIPLS